MLLGMCMLDYLTLTMKVLWSFLQDIKNPLTLHNIPEVLNPQLCHCKNLHSMYFHHTQFHPRCICVKTDRQTTYLHFSQSSVFCFELSASRYLETTQSWHWVTENLAAVTELSHQNHPTVHKGGKGEAVPVHTIKIHGEQRYSSTDS